MVAAWAKTQDGGMNETPPRVEADSDAHGFDAHRVRGITDVKRSSDDRMIAGVCSGLARYLNIDPVILRVVLVALTFIGFSGVILYAAAWFFLPADDAPKSIAARWFKLDENEEQVRIVGLIIAGVVAVTSASGVFDGNWNGPFPWFALVGFAILYFWVIKPARRRKEEAAMSTPVTTQTDDGHTVTQVLDVRPPKKPRTPWSPTLTLMTLSSALVAMGLVALLGIGADNVATYAVTALAVIAVGLLVGTFWGNGGLLIPIGAIVAVVLAVSSCLPSARIGHDVFPESSTTVSDSYKLGIGELDLNLNELSDPTQLNGRTIRIKVGIGQTRIVVPFGTNVEVKSTLRAGEIAVFDRKVNGTDNTLNYPADDANAPKLTLVIKQSVGNIEVIKQ